MTKPNVYCIGLPKTGTTSLLKALEILGWDTSPSLDPFNDEKLKDMSFGKYELPMVSGGAFGDVFVSGHWKTFMGLNKGKASYRKWKHDHKGKFILTIRDLDSWVDSFINTQMHRKPMFIMYEPLATYNGGNIAPTMGENSWAGRLLNHLINASERLEDREYLKLLHIAHLQEVREAFKGSDDLLIYDVEQGWEPLVKFLTPVPDTPFPHANKRSDNS